MDSILIAAIRNLGNQGRTASHLTAPSQIPACGFPAQGSSILFASYKNIINILFAIPRSEVGKRYRPFLSVLVSFAGYTIPSSLPRPVQQAPVIGATVSEYYEMI
ncbi:hypothetical protein ACFL1Z_02835 [Thermodesulfobacteriota bacterium]